ncbi:MAG: MFS transporter [Myxococcales bacterium]|nr:MFS transporter [Myxococcales bacterium]
MTEPVVDDKPAPATPEAAPPGSGGHTRALATVWFTLFLDLVSFGIVIPVLPFYATHFGAPPWLVTLLATGYSAAQFVMAPVLGRLSDQHGRRPVMLISIAGSVIAMLVLGFAWALWMVFLARIISGVCNANVSTAHAYVADRVPPAQRARYMGMMGTAVGLGFIVGPSIGGLLSWEGHEELPFLVGGGLSLVNWLMAFFWLPESHRPSRAPPASAGRRPSLLRALADPEFWRTQLGVLVLVGFGFFVAFAAMEATFALFTEARFAWTARETGKFFSLIGVVIVLAQGVLVGRAVAAIGERRTLIVGLCSLVVGFATLALAPVWWILPLAGACIAGGNGLIMPSFSALVSQNSTADNQGVNIGLTQSGGALGRIVGPMLAGLFFEVVGPGAPMASAACVAGSVAILVLLMVQEPRPKAA